MSKTIDPTVRAQAVALWNLFQVVITRFNPSLTRHEKHDFLGYVNLQLVGREGTPAAGFNLYLPGCKAKVLASGPYLDMPAKKGENGKFYTDFCTGNHASRLLLEGAVFHPTSAQAAPIRAAIEAIAKMAKPGAAPAAVEGASQGSLDDIPF